jgi:hypothetical protein
MEVGTAIDFAVGELRQSSSFRESQPQPVFVVPAVPGYGFRPGRVMKPSSVPETRISCPSQLGTAASSKVRSAITNLRASAARLGIWLGLYWT